MELRIDNQLDEKTEITIRTIIGAAIDVHRELGPGYLEKVYEQAMALELSVEMLIPIHEAQILSYLKSTGLPAGLLINFKERLVKDGIKRFVQSKHYNN